MSPRNLSIAVLLTSLVGSLSLAISTLSALGAPPIKLTDDVAPVQDLIAEIDSLTTTVDQITSSDDAYGERQGQLNRLGLQIAILAQTIADHETDSMLRKSAPAIRHQAALLGSAKSRTDATMIATKLKELRAGPESNPSVSDAEWRSLARSGALMPILKERSEAIRRGLRRPKDPDAESRQALMMALVSLALHEDTHLARTPSDQAAWQSACLELQRQLSRTASAIKTRDKSAAEYFRMGMEACDRCHMQFKP